MLGIVIGLAGVFVVGAVVVAYCCAAMAGRADRELERQWDDENK